MTLASSLHSSSPQVLAKFEAIPNKKLFQQRCEAQGCGTNCNLFLRSLCVKGAHSPIRDGKIHVHQHYWLQFICLQTCKQSKNIVLSSTSIFNVITHSRNHSYKCNYRGSDSHIGFLWFIDYW